MHNNYYTAFYLCTIFILTFNIIMMLWYVFMVDVVTLVLQAKGIGRTLHIALLSCSTVIHYFRCIMPAEHLQCS